VCGDSSKGLVNDFKLLLRWQERIRSHRRRGIGLDLGPDQDQPPLCARNEDEIRSVDPFILLIYFLFRKGEAERESEAESEVEREVMKERAPEKRETEEREKGTERRERGMERRERGMERREMTRKEKPIEKRIRLQKWRPLSAKRR
jgi:hypothetical protein